MLPRVNNFDIKQKRHHQYMPPTPNKIYEVKGYQNTTNFGQNTGLFRKNWTTTYLTTTPSKSFYIIFVDIFDKIIINSWKNQ